MEKLLTVAEVADLLGISVGAAYRWLSQGRLPCIRFSARCVRFRESDLVLLIDDLKGDSSRKSVASGLGRDKAAKALR
jgi:excisionase family DNA binding protein